MQPLPSYQLIPFLDWLYHRGYSTGRVSGKQLERLAVEFLQGHSQDGIVGVMTVFQQCPMITEGTIEAQMDHFSECGQCFDMVGRRGPGPEYETRSHLHPLLSGFTVTTAGKNLDERIKLSSARRDTKRKGAYGWYVAFRSTISDIGPELRRGFLEYLADVRGEDPRLIDDYLAWHSSPGRWEGQPSRDADHLEFPIDRGIESHSLRSHAQRLAASAEIAITSSYYDKQIAQDGHFARLVVAIGGDSPENAAQILEFLTWLHQRVPDVKLPGNAPSSKLSDLAQEFCEARGYTNGLTFSKEAQRWLSGAGSSKITSRISNFLGIGKSPKNREESQNPLDRYGAIRFHGLFLFLSSGDFPRFIDDHWRDLHFLTGDDIDIYYSESDLEQRTSGYEIASHFRSLSLRADALPALLLWEGQIGEGRALPLGDLDHRGIVEVMKSVVQAIRDGYDFDAVMESGKSRASELRTGQDKFPAIQHEGLLIVGGAVTNESYDVSHSQVAALGHGAVAHNNVFVQDARQALSGNELSPTDSQLVSRLAEIVASRDIEDIGLGERLDGARYLAALAEAANEGNSQEAPLAGWKQWIANLGNRSQKVLTFLAGATTIAAPVARLLGVPV